MAETNFLSQKNLRSSNLGLVWLPHDAISGPGTCLSLCYLYVASSANISDVKCGHCICLCCRKKKEEGGKRKKCSSPSWVNLLQSIFLEETHKNFCLVIPRESEECSILAEVNNSFLWSTKQNIKLLLFLLPNRKKNCERQLYPFLETYPVAEPLMSPSLISILF